MSDEAKTYNHADYTKNDIERHAVALASAIDKGLMRGYNQLGIAIGPKGEKFAKRILTRAPLAVERNEWNVTARDKIVYDELASIGFYILFFLWDEKEDTFKEMSYKDFQAKAVRRKGKGGGPDYYQVVV